MARMCKGWALEQALHAQLELRDEATLAISAADAPAANDNRYATDLSTVAPVMARVGAGSNGPL